MSDPRKEDPGDGELWRRYLRAGRRRIEPDQACLDAADLAAYADGRTRGDQLDRIEAHLAACEECLSAVQEARALRRAPPPVAPPELVARAKSLVAARATAWRKLGSWVGLRGRQGRWHRALRWAGGIAAAVLVGLAGFFAGSATYRSRQAADARIAAEVSFELPGSAEDDALLLADDIELLLSSKAEGGEK